MTFATKSAARRLLAGAAAALAALAMLPAQASGLAVLACEPEWAALAAELGGERVRVSSATTALQDPHRIEARPSLIARARNADLLVCTGMELEAGWLPVLVQQSGNPKIAEGRPGHFLAGAFVKAIDVPERLDRADGDVHAAGNPHIQLDPRNIAIVAAALARRMAELDPANAAFYDGRQRDFQSRWSAALQRWERLAAPLRNVAVIEHHRNMGYLLHWLGMRSVGTLEPKPGVEPGAAHLSSLVARLQQQPAKMVLRAAYQDGRASQWLSERARIAAVAVPFTVGGSERAKDLFGLFDDTVARLLEGAR